MAPETGISLGLRSAGAGLREGLSDPLSKMVEDRAGSFVSSEGRVESGDFCWRIKEQQVKHMSPELLVNTLNMGVVVLCQVSAVSVY